MTIRRVLNVYRRAIRNNFEQQVLFFCFIIESVFLVYFCVCPEIDRKGPSFSILLNNALAFLFFGVQLCGPTWILGCVSRQSTHRIFLFLLLLIYIDCWWSVLGRRVTIQSELSFLSLSRIFQLKWRISNCRHGAAWEGKRPNRISFVTPWLHVHPSTIERRRKKRDTKKKGNVRLQR